MAACLLALVAAWNGHPFMYPDTPTYLRGAEMGAAKIVGAGRLPSWLAPATGSPAQADAPLPAQRAASVTSVDDKIVLAGRSVYYGALLYLGFLAGSLGWVVLVQGLCVAAVLHLVMVRLWGLHPTTFLASVALLAALTPLGVFTSLLMPDVFAGLTVLCIAVLAVHEAQLTRWQRAWLALLLVFALASHASHVALAAVLLGGLVLARAWPRGRSLSLRGIGMIAASLAAALLAEAAFNKAVTLAVGAPPLRLPHLTARLVDRGPGTDFLRQECSRQPYAACAFVDNYPTRWDEFLFSTDPRRGAFALADPDGKRRMSREQLGLAWAIVKHDTAGVLSVVATDIVRQAGLFQVDVAGVGTDQLATSYAWRVPAPVLAAMQRTRTLDSHAAHDFFTTVTQASVGASLMLAAVLAWRRWRRGAAASACAGVPGFGRIVALVIAGVLANALVCAVLAGALERFQARVIWLVPFIALAWAALALRQRRAAAAAPAGADTGAPIGSFERPAP